DRPCHRRPGQVHRQTEAHEYAGADHRAEPEEDGSSQPDIPTERVRAVGHPAGSADSMARRMALTWMRTESGPPPPGLRRRRTDTEGSVSSRSSGRRRWSTASRSVAVASDN